MMQVDDSASQSTVARRRILTSSLRHYVASQRESDGAQAKEAQLRHANSRLTRRMVVLGVAGGIAVTAFGPLLPLVSPSTAEASVAFGKDDDKKKEDKKKDKDGNHDQDHTLNGQVLEINTLVDPPELIVGSVDGRTVVRVLKTDEIARNGVKVGDYIECEGEKVHEQLFEATQITVSSHYQDEDSDNDNKDEDD